MLRKILKFFGYYKIDYGFACGRHWIEIDGNVIAQTSGDEVWLRDEDVHRIGYTILDKGEHWDKPIPYGCNIDVFSSRICQQGTRSCIINHGEY